MDFEEKHDAIRHYIDSLDDLKEEERQMKARLLDLLEISRQLDTELDRIMTRLERE